MSAADPDISVCIATYRRPEGIARLIESLGELELPEGVAIELIVVDNDPEESAAQGMLSWAPGPHPVQVLCDPRRLNLSHVRNSAVEAARGVWVAFIDDDEVASKNWLAAYWSPAQRHDIDGWFGPVLPRLERRVTPWLDLETFYVRPRHHTGTRISAADARTSNAFVRRELMLREPFDPAYGLLPECSEDYEVFSRQIARGARFAWCDQACVVETIPPERHGVQWLARRSYLSGLMMARVTRDMAKPRSRARKLLVWALRYALGIGLLLAAIPTLALRGRAAAARLGFRACVQVGHLRSLLDRDVDRDRDRP